MYRTKCYTLDGATVYTVTHTDAAGEEHDLGWQGACLSLADLRDFIAELHGQGAYDADTMADLLATVEGL
jgi:hypothetical protein